MPSCPPITGESRPGASVSAPVSIPPVTGESEAAAFVAARAHLAAPSIRGFSLLRGLTGSRVSVALPPLQGEGGLAADITAGIVVSLPPVTSEERLSGNVWATNWPPNFTQALNISAIRRPYAITFDGLTAFDMGPIALSDTSQGLYARAWRIQVDGTDVYISGAENGAWGSEELLFSYTGEQGASFDLTFDQNGRPFVCWEQGGSVWIYYYDPALPGMTVREVCGGRTPRVRLDIRNPVLISDSDILLFYINEAEDRVEYRVQRDRYSTVYASGLTSTSNKHLELLAMGENNRLYLWYSRYDPQDRWHILCAWHSAPYPAVTSEQIAAAGDSIVSGTFVTLYKSSELEESVELSGDAVQGAETVYIDPFTEVTLDDEEIELTGDSITSAETVYLDPYVDAAVDDESVELSGDNIQSVEAVTVMLNDEMDDEEITITGDTVQSATKS